MERRHKSRLSKRLKKPNAIHKMLECPLCVIYFDMDMRVAKNLVCGHTYCLPCLSSLMQDTTIICCPSCSSDTKIQDSPAELATNSTIADLIDFICEDCLLHPRIQRCRHCHKMICAICAKLHRETFHGEVLGLIDTVKEDLTRLTEMSNDNSQLYITKQQADMIVKEIDDTYRGLIELLERQQKALKKKVQEIQEKDAGRFLGWREQLYVKLMDVKHFLDVSRGQLGESYDGHMTDDELGNVKDGCDEIVQDLRRVEIAKPEVGKFYFRVNRDQMEECLSDCGQVVPLEITSPAQDVQTEPETIYMSPASALLESTVATPKQICGKKGSELCEFWGPWGAAVSRRTSNIVITDCVNHRVQILKSDFKFVSSFGNQGQGEGEFRYPRGVAIDSLDNVFIADGDNHRIQVTDPSGRFLRMFGSWGSDPGQFLSPFGLAFDRDDNLYVCDKGNFRVQVLSPEGHFLRTFGTKGSGTGQFRSEPLHIALTRNNRVITSDIEGNLYMFTSDGEHIRTVRCGVRAPFLAANGVAVDANGHILVADSAGRLVVLREDAGGVISYVRTPGQDRRQLHNPAGLAVTNDNSVLVCEWGNNRIQMFEIPAFNNTSF